MLLIRIPRSWAGPHRVSYKAASQFYSRTSAGKYPLDITELRAAFLVGTTLGEQIRDFRDQRLGRIIAGETPVPMRSGAKVLFTSFRTGPSVPSVS